MPRKFSSLIFRNIFVLELFDMGKDGGIDIN